MYKPWPQAYLSNHVAPSLGILEASPTTFGPCINECMKFILHHTFLRGFHPKGPFVYQWPSPSVCLWEPVPNVTCGVHVALMIKYQGLSHHPYMLPTMGTNWHFCVLFSFGLFWFDLFMYLFIFAIHEVLDHLASFSSSREIISWSRIESPTTPFGLGTFPLSSSSLRSSWTRLVWIQFAEI